jgi:phage major head subunit gpT-like protein
MKTLRERNMAIIKRNLENQEGVRELREGLKKRFGADPVTDTENFPILEGRFSWKKLLTKLAEADASSSFPQFLRAGLQQIVNGMYQATDVTYTDWATVVPSSKRSELYAPNQGIAFPRQVGPQEAYPEVGAAALDLQLQNLKFGSIYALEKELLDDDQSGTFAQQAGMLGEYLHLLIEVLCYGKLASVANMQYADYQIPVSETKPSYESSYPWSQSFRGGGANRPASYTVLTQSGITAGILALQNQKNLQGLKMLVQPKRLIVGTQSQFDASVLLNSSYYPSGAAAAGATGGAFAINPIKSIADLTVSRFIFKNNGTVTGDSKAWYLVDDSKPWFVVQNRQPAAVTQEDVNSGTSFEQDVYRFKGTSRGNADFIDPRFAYQGNDGSVTS